MSLAQRRTAATLQGLGEDDRPGGHEGIALMTTCAVVLSDKRVPVAPKLVLIGIAITLELIEWWKKRKAKGVPQWELIEGYPNEGGMVYHRTIKGGTKEVYTFKYSPPTNDKITGIACTAVDKETPSPRVDLSDGGVGYNHVTIRLTPVNSDKWACHVDICTEPSSVTPDMEADSTRAATAEAETTHAAAPPAEATSAAAPPSH